MERLYLDGQTEIANSLEFKNRVAEFKNKSKIYKSTFDKEKIPLTLTFNDVLMIPQYGEI